jgi:hypothetical protein
MAQARELLGYIMGAIFASIALLMMVLAWMGLNDAYSWKMALGLLVFSMIIRVNLFLVAGCYLFAHSVWGFSVFESMIFALPSLMYIAPAVSMPMFGAISRPNTGY